MTKKLIIALLVVAGVLAFTPSYAALPKSKPNKAFFTSAWDKALKNQQYTEKCKAVIGSIKTTGTLSAEQKTVLDMLKKAKAGYSGKAQNTIVGAEKKIEGSIALKNPFSVFTEIGAKLITMDEGKAKIGDVAVKLFHYVVTPENIYYTPDLVNWKKYVDASTSESLYKSALEGNLVDGYQKATFIFKKWILSDDKKTNWAMYTGKFDKDAVDSMITETLGVGFIGIANKGDAVMYFDQKTGVLKKYEQSVALKMGKVSFPVTQICTIVSGAGVSINPPTENVSEVSIEEGGQEFLNMIQALFQ